MWTENEKHSVTLHLFNPPPEGLPSLQSLSETIVSPCFIAVQPLLQPQQHVEKLLLIIAVVVFQSTTAGIKGSATSVIM